MNRLIIFILISFFFKLSFGVSDEYFPFIADWKLSIEKYVYTPDDLWEILGEAADIYISYGFDELHSAEYTNEEGKYVRVEIFKHNSVANAFGIYALERMSDFKILKIGVQGYAIPGALNFFTGNLYIKIMNFGTKLVSEFDLIEIGESLETHLQKADDWPLPLALFPAENKVSLSENYIPDNFMGYGFLSSAFTALYEGQSSFRLFIINTETTVESKEMFENYIGIFNEEKVTCEGNLYFIKDLFNGNVVIANKSNFIVGAIQYSEKETVVNYISDILQKL